MRGSLTMLAVAGLLAGCSYVEADQPLFVEADRATVRLEHGLWAVATEEPCVLPTHARVTLWPECATPLMIDATTVRAVRRHADDNLASATWLIASGDPLIVQTRADGGAWTFGRATVERTSGQVRQARVAPLICPPEEIVVAGLRRVAEGGCRAESADAVRRVAAAQGEEGLPAVWIAAAAD